MSGHDHHAAAPQEEDHTINIKVGAFFVCVLLSLFVIAMINS